MSNEFEPNPARWLEPGAFAQSVLLRNAFTQPAVAAGTRLGAYVVVEEIARGGMGVVYLAERADGQFAQRVAIKVVHASRSAVAHDLFLRERQLLADFKHARVARLLDGGGTEEGLLWCAMELVDGATLDVHLDQTKPSLIKRLGLLMQLCDAVQSAHARLLVHRDIKPGNVMVDADSSAKLLDFGIATWAQDNSDTRAYSPAWASPEQLSNDVIGPASDQYQLGRLLLLMLEGTHPTGERGRELSAIAARATQVQPDKRYASVAQFSEDLQRWTEKRPVLSYSQRWRYQMRAAIRRHPLQSAAFIAIGALAIGLTSFSQWRLAQQRDRAEYQAETAKSINQFLQNDLLMLADPNLSQDAQLKVSTLLERASSSIEKRFGNRPEIAAELHTMLGRGLRELDALEASEQQFERAQELAKTSFTGNDPRLLSLEFEHAELERQASKFGAAHHRLKGLEQRAADVLGAESELALATRARRCANAFYAGIDRPLAIKELSALQPTLDRVLGPSSLPALRALNETSIMLTTSERHEEAALVRKEHIQRASAHYGTEHSIVLVSRTTYAQILRAQGRHQEALEQAEIAERGLEKIFGADSVSTLFSVNARSRILFDMGDSKTAITLQRRLLTVRTRLLGEEHEQVANSAINLGAMLQRTGFGMEAIEPLQKGVEIYRKVLGPEHPEFLSNMALLGDALRANGNLADADRYLTEALASGERFMDRSSLALASIRFRYAQLKVEQKLPELAHAPLQAALVQYRTQLGPAHKRTLDAEKLGVQLGVPASN